MTELASTVPGAVAALNQHMIVVAAATAVPEVGVYLGEIIGPVANNFLSIGHPTGDGEIVLNYQSDFHGMAPSGHVRRTEAYELACVLRTWTAKTGGTAPIDRLSAAFSLLADLGGRLAVDRNAGGALGSGVWGLSTVENPRAGRMQEKGFGVELTFTVAITNVLIRSV